MFIFDEFDEVGDGVVEAGDAGADDGDAGFDDCEEAACEFVVGVFVVFDCA